MFFSPALYVTPIVLIVALVLIMASVKILREYERAIVFTLGGQKVKGPDLVLLIPLFSGNGAHWFANPCHRDTRPRT